MSHIIFGDFCRENLDNDIIQELKNKLILDEMLIFFDEEIDFYDDIRRMLNEQAEKDIRSIFCVTSSSQQENSEDLLFPYNNFSENELFPDGEDRKVFEEKCMENLVTIKSGIIDFINILRPYGLRIFVAGGYDDNFNVMQCTLDDMIIDIWRQVVNAFTLESKIYELI